MYKRKYKKYSFIRPDLTLRNNLMAFGFECNEGWYPIIFEAFDKIQELLDGKLLKYKDNFQVVQVKEKFATLRVYTFWETKEIEDIIKEAQDKALVTCEACGQMGEERERNGWYKVLCNECYEKWAKYDL